MATLFQALGQGGLKALAPFSPVAANVPKIVRESNLLPPAVNQAKRAVQTQAPSLFEKIGSSIKSIASGIASGTAKVLASPIQNLGVTKIFTPTPTPAPSRPKTASFGEILNNSLISLENVFLGSKNPNTGQSTEGLLNDIIRNKLIAPADPIIRVQRREPEPPPPPPGVGTSALLERSQPVGLFSVGFPAPPPTQNTITVTGLDGSAQKAAGIPIWVWIALALVVLLLIVKNK